MEKILSELSGLGRQWTWGLFMAASDLLPRQSLARCTFRMLADGQKLSFDDLRNPALKALNTAMENENTQEIINLTLKLINADEERLCRAIIALLNTGPGRVKRLEILLWRFDDPVATVQSVATALLQSSLRCRQKTPQALALEFSTAVDTVLNQKKQALIEASTIDEDSSEEEATKDYWAFQIEKQRMDTQMWDDVFAAFAKL